jgi:hypothetical protein
MRVCSKHYDLPGYHLGKECPYCEPRVVDLAKCPTPLRTDSGEDEIKRRVADRLLHGRQLAKPVNFGSRLYESFNKHTHVTDLRHLPEKQRPFYAPSSPPCVGIRCAQCSGAPFHHAGYGYGCIRCMEWFTKEQVWRKWDASLPYGNYWTVSPYTRALSVIPHTGLEPNEWVLGPLPEPKAPDARD